MNSLVIASSSASSGAGVAGAAVAILIALLVLRRRRGTGDAGASRKRAIVLLSVCAGIAVLGLIGSLIASAGREPAPPAGERREP